LKRDKLETPMILRYWDTVGGTLIPEFQAVARSTTAARRLIDSPNLIATTRGGLKASSTALGSTTADTADFEGILRELL
jgi:hypothetical protein